MMDFSLRIGIFFLLLCLLTAWQWQAPRAGLEHWKQRWFHNFGLLFFGALCTRFIKPFLLSLVAYAAPNAGLFDLINIPFWLQFCLSLIVLDGVIYWQHRLFHKISWLWRMHKVHHSDQQLDVSSAVRFHPFEIALSLVIKSIAIWLFGIPVEAILVFDILLNGFAMFNHTNARLPQSWEKWVRYFIVTPDMHRIHHSARQSETDSNYGFCLSIWDRLFASYTEDAKGGDSLIQIGLPQTHTNTKQTLRHLLWMPLDASNRIMTKPDSRK